MSVSNSNGACSLPKYHTLILSTVTGEELKCTIMFSNEEIDTGSGSSFVM